MIAEAVKAGDRVATVGRDGSNMAKTGPHHTKPIWTGKVYEARPRQSDGTLTWRLVDTFGGTRSGDEPSAKFQAELQEQAPAPWKDGVLHNNICNPD